MGGSESKPGQYELPEKMKRIVLAEPNDDMTKVKLEMEEVDLPQPQAGEVLVRLVATPVNPSDYGKWRMSRQGAGTREPIGNEGAGIVVKCGGGATAPNWKYLGKKVGCVRMQALGGGSYQEYARASVIDGVFPLPDEVDVQDAASFFVNPYTCVGICDTVKADGATGFIHTAAASQLGQMIVKYLKTPTAPKIKVINVVRREEQAELLREIGAEYIVVSSKDGWKDDLKALIDEHKITHAFDAIAGETTGELMTLLPPKGKMYVYGGLSEKGCSGISPMDLIYHQKVVKGWLLPNHIKGEGSTLSAARRLNAMTKHVNAGLLPEGWARTQYVDCTPEEMFDRFLELRASGCTGQKLRVRWMDDEALAALEAAFKKNGKEVAKDKEVKVEETPAHVDPEEAKEDKPAAEEEKKAEEEEEVAAPVKEEEAAAAEAEKPAEEAEKKAEEEPAADTTQAE